LNFSGDSLITKHNGFRFSTTDRDYDAYKAKCTDNHHGSWWYNTCRDSNLNGRYYYNAQNSNVDSVNWTSWKKDYPLKATEMKFRASF